jgi:hypothetical protein
MENDTTEDINTLIERILADFEVDGKKIPVRFLQYNGHDEPYVVNTPTSNAGVLRADDQVQKYVQYVDFGVYSKGNYTNIVKQLKSKLIENGFMWQPENDLEPMYNVDTEYYIKVINFAIERSI